MPISTYFPDVSSLFYFEYHTGFQDCELKSANVSVNDGFNGVYEKHIKKNVKCDVNVKIKNIRTRLFRVSVFDVQFTNFTHKVFDQYFTFQVYFTCRMLHSTESSFDSTGLYHVYRGF